MAFRKKFGTAVARIHKRRAVMNMEIGFKETVDEYSNRFFRTVGEAGYHRDDLTIGDVFLLSLPKPWQLNICTVLLSNTKRQAWTTTKIHNAAIDLLGEKTPESLLPGKDAKRKFLSVESPIAATSSAPTATSSTLPRARMLGDRNLPNKASTKATNLCRHCGRPWRHGHTCEEYRTAKRQKGTSGGANVLSVAASDTKEENETDMMAQALKEAYENDDIYKCKISKTEPMEVTYANNIKFTYEFEVIEFNDELSTEFDVLLGVDILPKMNIYL
ncbi:hypothetical protein FB192DRAFT_1337880 [Mucor lusitanicus]|uniref:Uncharacterized protein n=1 Tax=Mucor circinelloides f. lusitanicus TaxID=29924 RepID=A0A8H4BRW5_MUCCL|nr:hypothetical protein FB192DRAFT_1337880 [Mucor lusitanicus]